MLLVFLAHYFVRTVAFSIKQYPDGRAGRSHPLRFRHSRTSFISVLKETMSAVPNGFCL